MLGWKKILIFKNSFYTEKQSIKPFLESKEAKYIHRLLLLTGRCPLRWEEERKQAQKNIFIHGCKKPRSINIGEKFPTATMYKK